MAEELEDGGEYTIKLGQVAYIYIEGLYQIVVDLESDPSQIRLAVWKHRGPGKKETGYSPVAELITPIA